MRHEVQHFKDYGTNIIIIACQHPPSVAEGWNAVFHALSAEPWGIYNARDTGVISPDRLLFEGASPRKQ